MHALNQLTPEVAVVLAAGVVVFLVVFRRITRNRR
jgi:hypothetical protein